MLSRLLKFIPFENLAKQDWRLLGKVVATNGCFDILHAGHVQYLEQAKQLGSSLVVGINSDASVRALKGESRPVNLEEDRLAVIAALGCVDFVTIFSSPSAADFLAAVKPDVWVKGGDYTVESLDAREREIVSGSGGQIHILPILQGRSTTQILQKVHPCKM